MSLLAGCGSDTTTDQKTNSETNAGSTADGESTVGGESIDPNSITTITINMDTDNTNEGIRAVAALAEEKIGVRVEFDERAGGDDGTNVVKTYLTSGDMADICVYNSGAKLSALNPSQYFVDLSDNTELMSRIDETFIDAVTFDEATYGVPACASQSGAVLYNKELYAQYNLEVPETWEEFLANCEVLEEAGVTSVLGSFADSWTCQVPLLGDNANVLAQAPDFITNMSAGTDKYATNQYALRSWEKLTELTSYYNDDYVTTTYNDCCDRLVAGEGGHWMILTMALGNIQKLYGEEVDKIGVFAIPADDAETTTLTTWMPNGMYVNKNSENVEAAIKFLEFFVTDEALDCFTETIAPNGPYCIKGYELPDSAYEGVAVDMQAYFDAGKTGLAAEFITDVMGPDCSQITQEAGSGQTTAEEAAAKYDDNCKLQAQQIGYDWAQ